MTERCFDANFCFELHQTLIGLRITALFADNEPLMEFFAGVPADDMRLAMKVICGLQAMRAFAHGDIATMNAIINQEKLNWMFQWDDHELDLISKGFLLTM